MLSTISQISGAVTNIVLDYIFIFPLGMGVAGAAWATVIGQFISLFIAMFFHYTKNKEINGNLKYIKPEIGIIKGIYKIGISAAIMQALLSVMMAGMNAILEEKTDKNIINNKLIISISREHGTGGKEIARKIARKLELKFFDKEEIKKFAINKNELQLFCMCVKIISRNYNIC